MESIIISPQLKFQQNEISTRAMNWETFLNASMISSAEMERIQKYDKLPQLKISEFKPEEFQEYFSTLVLFLQKIVRVDTVQYLLVKLDICTSLLDGYLPRLSDKSIQDAYQVLVRCLSKEDDLSKIVAVKILAHLVVNVGRLPESAFNSVLNWSLSLISTYKASDGLDIALQCISCLLRTPDYRLTVYQYPRCINSLIEFLVKGSCTPQINYQIVFSFWLLTFIPSAVVELQRKYDIIPLLMDIAKNALKEKVVRICVLTLRNLLEKAPEANIMAMVGNKLYTLCDILSSRKWTDEDIIEDLKFITTELQYHIQKLTNFDEYASEVRSGRLDWSPTHTSESFWKQNAQKLNEKDHELLRILTKLLATTTSPLVLAVACHDVMQYIKYYPYGKRFVQDLGAKQQIMELMTHKDPEVRYNALMAIQQYMSNAWDFQ